MRRASLVAVVLAVAPALARADVLPEPERPQGWEPRTPPTPAPPPEKELPPAALWFAAIALAGAIVVVRARPQERAR
jgi:hypothetical protein